MDRGQTHDEVHVIPPAKPGGRIFSAAEKQRIVEETSAPGQSVSTVARRHGVSPSLLFRWRRLADAGTVSSLKADEPMVSESEVKELRAQAS